MHRVLLLALIAALLGLSSAFAGIAVQPTHLYLSATAGETLETGIDLAPMGEASPVTVSLTSFDIDANGNPHTCADAARSIVGWLEGAQPLPRIRLDQPIRMSVALNVPRTAQGTYWGALAIEAAENEIDGIPVRMRIVVPIVITVSGTERAAASFSSLNAACAGDEIVVAGVLTNSGNTVLSTADLTARFRSEAVPLSTTGEATIVLPGARRAFSFRIPAERGVVKGSPVEVRVERAGGGSLTTATCPISD